MVSPSPVGIGRTGGRRGCHGRRWARKLVRRLSSLPLRFKFSPLLAITFSRQRRLDTLFLTRLQIIRVPLDLSYDLFVEYFALETAESTFQTLTFMELNLGHGQIHLSSLDSIFQGSNLAQRSPDPELYALSSLASLSEGPGRRRNTTP